VVRRDGVMAGARRGARARPPAVLISRSRVVKQFGLDSDSDSDSACSRRRATQNESLWTARERVAVVGRRRSPFGFLFVIRRAGAAQLRSRHSAVGVHSPFRQSQFASPRRAVRTSRPPLVSRLRRLRLRLSLSLSACSPRTSSHTRE